MQTPDAPQWPDGGARPPGVVYVPPGANVKHECPPDRVTMLQNLTELQASYDTRLRNQKQVIENISTKRMEALVHIRDLHRFLDTLLESQSVTGPLELKARQLLQWEQ